MEYLVAGEEGDDEGGPVALTAAEIAVLMAREPDKYRQGERGGEGVREMDPLVRAKLDALLLLEEQYDDEDPQMAEQQAALADRVLKATNAPFLLRPLQPNQLPSHSSSLKPREPRQNPISSSSSSSPSSVLTTGPSKAVRFPDRPIGPAPSSFSASSSSSSSAAPPKPILRHPSAIPQQQLQQPSLQPIPSSTRSASQVMSDEIVISDDDFDD